MSNLSSHAATPQLGHTISVASILNKMVTPRRVDASETERAILARATFMHVLHKGHRLAVWRWGTEGPLVLLVHGWDSRASHLGAFVEPLLAAGYRVLAFDGPGQGDSEGVRSNVVDLGQAILDVVEATGPVSAAIGHSMGSAALLYAFAHGLETGASVHIAGPSSLRGVLIRTAAMLELNMEQGRELISLMEGETGLPVDDMELSALAHGLRHPALILHDPEDREIPFGESERLNTAWAQATLHPMPGLGHRRIISAVPAIDLSLELIARHLPAHTQNSSM